MRYLFFFETGITPLACDSRNEHLLPRSPRDISVGTSRGRHRQPGVPPFSPRVSHAKDSPSDKCAKRYASRRHKAKTASLPSRMCGPQGTPSSPLSSSL